jgi:hypothetical protein
MASRQRSHPDRLGTFDKVSERVVGWTCLIAAGVEVAAPALLAIDLVTSGGLATAGFLLATGRADKAVSSMVAALRRMVGQ